MSFAERLTHLRKLRKLSQQQLAQRSNVSQQAISKLERGLCSPSEFTIRQLADALRVQITDLLEEQNNATADGGGILADIIERVRHLNGPALGRLSDYIDGLEDGQETASPSPAAHDSAAANEK